MSVSHVNKQWEAHSQMCNNLTIEIREFCRKHKSHLSGANIPGYPWQICYYRLGFSKVLESA